MPDDVTRTQQPETPAAAQGTRMFGSPDGTGTFHQPTGPGEPVPLPEISYHVEYDLGADVTAYRLATDTYPAGRPGGASIHGYCVNGWEPEIQATWIANCVNARVSCGSHLLGDGRQITGID